jgi:hypothetical protein
MQMTLVKLNHSNSSVYSVEVAQEMGLRPLARILGFADGEGEPPEFPTGKPNQMVDVCGLILLIFTSFSCCQLPRWP